MKKVINENIVDFTKQPLFFGEGLNIQRYDVFKYKRFFDSYKEQMSFFWRPEEVSLVKDCGDFKKLPEHQQKIFTKNLFYQTLLDSVQARAIPYISAQTSLPEFEACCTTWQFFEQIHSYSYTYIIKNIYPNPTEIFDQIMKDEQIIKRATSVTKYYNDLIESVASDDINDKKKKLYLTLVSVNILEGIRFYVSFACSFCFAQNKTLEGSAKLISLINRDENLHLAITQNVLKMLRTNESEGFVEIAKECEPIVYQMYKDASREEIEWAKYLFEDGSMMGLNAEILEKYMMWLTNKRISGIGLTPFFEKTENPIGWIKAFTDSKDVQVAPQETEIESYKIGAIKNDIETMDFSKFEI